MCFREISMSDFITGSPARGDDFHFRGSFLEDLKESLNHEHVLLLAPRRMGKTSVMLRLQDEAILDRTVVFLNVEEITTPAEFCQSLITALHDQHPEYIRQSLAKTWKFLGGIVNSIDALELYKFKIALRKSDPDWETNWMMKADELIANLRRTQEPLLIILDEVPDMILNMQAKAMSKLTTFLHWFRKTRQDPRQDTIRWLVGGSINLTSTLDQLASLKLINDFRSEPLPPFEQEEVDTFIRSMFDSHGVQYEPEVIEDIQQRLGKPIPFFLQLFAQELYRKWRRQKTPLTIENVESVFNRVLLGETARDKLQYYHTRIRNYYTDQERVAATKILDQLSISDTSLTKDALFTTYAGVEETKPNPRMGPDLQEAFNNLMLLLQNDFYIEEVETKQYDFSCTILKLWWRKYYG